MTRPVPWAISLALALAACDGPPRPAAPPRTKDALYGDPALVPTRAGERAREELARAGAVAAALRALGADGPLHVEVRLPHGDDPGAAVVAGQGPPGLAEADARALAVELCGPWSERVARVHLRPPAAAAPGPAGPARGLPLALALLGLGASAGITLDRLRRRG